MGAPIRLVETRRHGLDCRHCKKPKPTNIVIVAKGQKIMVDGMPFEVQTQTEFERCLRCGAFFLKTG
jgi:hypothetical protein